MVIALAISVLAIGLATKAYAQTTQSATAFGIPIPDGISILFALTSFAGTLTYIYSGWKTSKKPFDFQKFFDTVTNGGSLMGVVTSALVLSSATLIITFISFLTAFIMGLAFAAKLKDAGKDKNPITDDVIVKLQVSVEQLKQQLNIKQATTI